MAREPSAPSAPPRLPLALFTCPRGGAQPSDELVAWHSWAALSHQLSVVLFLSPNSSSLYLLVREIRNRTPSLNLVALQLDESALVSVSSEGEPERTWVPSIAGLFARAESAPEAASCKFFAYVNSDIVLPPNFGTRLAAVFAAVPRRQRALTVVSAHRYDCPMLNGSMRQRIVTMHPTHVFEAVWAAAKCRPHKPTGKDYFVYHRGFWRRPGLPKFSIGRKMYDNYLVEAAMHTGTLIDTSAILPCLHINHLRLRTKGNVRLDEAQSQGNMVLMTAALLALGLPPSRRVCGRIDAANIRACPSAVASEALENVYLRPVRPACCQTLTCCKTDAEVVAGCAKLGLNESWATLRHIANDVQLASRMGDFPSMDRLASVGLPMPWLRTRATTGGGGEMEYARMFGCR